MAEPTVHMKNFGGVDFNWNEVKSAKVQKGKDGKETYFIEFKTGVKAEYPIQNGASMNSRELTMWQSLDYDNQTVINGMKGARITGSQNDDHIVAAGIHGCTIDVNNDNNDDHIEVINIETDQESVSSSGNTILLDKNDTATERIYYNKDSYTTKVKGPGVENRF